MHPEAWKLCNEAAQEYERVGSPHTFSHREYSKRMNIGRMLGQFARSRKDWWGFQPRSPGKHSATICALVRRGV